MRTLTQRFLSVLLSAVLLLTVLCPVLTVSAKEDPLVLAASFGGLFDQYLEFRYNAEGQVVEKTNRSTKEITEITYHSSGNIKKERTLVNNKVTQVREYDYNGNITRVAHADPYGNMVDDQLFSNKYDENGRLTYLMMYEDGNPTQEAWFSYNLDGSFMVDWTYYTMNINQKTPFMHRIGHFTKEGKLIHRTVDLEYTKPYNEIYNLTLDSFGNPAVETYYYSEGDRFSGSAAYYLNEYDASGNLLSVEKRISDFSTSDKEPSERVEKTFYSYDRQGRLIKKSSSENFDGVFDSSWDYDVNGNLVSYTGIHEICSELDYFMMRNNGATAQYASTAYEYYPISKALK